MGVGGGVVYFIQRGVRIQRVRGLFDCFWLFFQRRSRIPNTRFTPNTISSHWGTIAEPVYGQP